MKRRRGGSVYCRPSAVVGRADDEDEATDKHAEDWTTNSSVTSAHCFMSHTHKHTHAFVSTFLFIQEYKQDKHKKKISS